MLNQNNTQRRLQCCECESEIGTEDKNIEIELYRYSRHGVGVAHVGRLCLECHGRMNAVMAAEA